MKRIFVGLLVLTGMALKAARAEDIQEDRRRGMISVTFHEHKDRISPANMYETKENGVTHWRNYKERKDAPERKERFVYELKNQPMAAQSSTSPKESEVVSAK